MKKLLLLFGLMLAFGTNMHGQLNFSINGSSCTTFTVQKTAVITATMPGANNYSWTVVGPSVQSSSSFSSNMAFNMVVGTGIYTVTCFANSNSTPVGSVSQTFQVGNAPVITVAANPSQNICGSGSATLTVSGAVSYTWAPGALTGPTVVVSPSVSTCYTVSGTSASGCSNSTVLCMNVAANAPTITTSPAGNFSLCSSGSGSLIMYASGATSYSWSTGSTGNSAVANALGCYTVYGFNGCGADTAVICATGTFSNLPISVSGNTAMCANSNGTFVVGGPGANVYNTLTWAGPGLISPNTGTMAVITPSANSCYTVTGTSGNCSSSANVCINITGGNLTVSGGGTVCTGSPNLFASGASSYTWTNGANTWTGSAITATAVGCYTVNSSNSCGTNSAVVCVNAITGAPVLAVAASAQTVCAGSPISFTASGANTYSWVVYTGSIISTYTTPVVNFTPYSLGTQCATLTGMNGCNSNTVVCFNVAANSNPVVITSSGGSCAGSQVTLTASGASNYTWSTGQTGNSIVVSPASPTCYSVVAPGSGCSNFVTATQCVSLAPAPVITVFGNTVLCSGQPSNFTASGATTYSWSNGSTGNIISYMPTSSGCFTVTGTTGQCQGNKVVCVTVNPSPTLSIAGPGTVCLGTSATFTASGASNFTWSTGSNASTVNILPTTSSQVAVYGNNGTGCSGTYTAYLTVNFNCSDVWPGDANSDGAVNTSDILELGLQANATGPVRAGGITWNAQYANNWSGTVSTGKNKAHADCNGDGVVNNSDATAVNTNFNNTHSFKPAAPTANSDIQLVTPQTTFYVNTWNTVDVMIGSPSQPFTMYGTAFDLNFDNSFIVPDSIALEYYSSAFYDPTQDIGFSKVQFANGKISAAVVKTNHQNVNYYGKLATLKFKVLAVAPTDELNLNISNAKVVFENGGSVPLTSGAVQLPVGQDVGLKEFTLQHAALYPNPANSKVRITSGNAHDFSYAVKDLTGRTVLAGQASSSADADISTLANGIYVVTISQNGASLNQKLVVEHK